MSSKLNIRNVNFRNPAVLMAIGIISTLVLAVAVVMVLLLTSGYKALSDNAALIGALVALGGVFTAQMVSIALDDRRTHEAALQNYFEQVGKLLIEQPLREASPGDNLSTVVRAQTLTVSEGLDPDGKRILLQFLYESGLINRYKPVVSLKSANLSDADLRAANLFRADLSEANLVKVNLFGTNLREADLSRTNLSRANLSKANLFRADLPQANLSGANLSEAILSKVTLLGANLRGADLRGADLSEATGITNEKLEQQASSLEGATMPDG